MIEMNRRTFCDSSLRRGSFRSTNTREIFPAYYSRRLFLHVFFNHVQIPTSAAEQPTKDVSFERDVDCKNV